jgi:release factor glutamine methyltransferase
MSVVVVEIENKRRPHPEEPPPGGVSKDGPSVAALICEGTKALRDANIENPRAEARLLLEHATAQSREALIGHPERVLRAGEARAFRALLRRRTKCEPMAYIRGEKEFWSLPFKVTPDVLIPRPDSECLIEAALREVPDRDAPLRVLDLGTGSGCLLLALLSERPRATGIGVDASEKALAVARANAVQLGLGGRAHFVCADWQSAIRGTFDVILANPPYIVDEEIAGLAPDVAQFEPRAALSGGADGFAAYRLILRDLVTILAEDGIAILEIGVGQAQSVDRIAVAAGLAPAGLAHDLAGHERGVLYRPARGKKLVGMGPATG